MTLPPPPPPIKISGQSNLIDSFVYLRYVLWNENEIYGDSDQHDHECVHIGLSGRKTYTGEMGGIYK